MSKRLLTSIFAAVLVVAVALAATGCGGNSPKGVVSAFFESVDKHDAKKFLNCFDKDTKESILDNVDEEDLKDQLEIFDNNLEEEYGKNWRNKVKIKDAEKEDEDDGVDYYSVTVEMEDEEDEIQVIKVKGKYYIDSSAMGSLLGGM